MILYGRNLSPFTRRVAIWCALQGRGLERRELPVAGEAFEEILAHNPVGRVPILILDDGTHLIETSAICDWLDDTAPDGARLVPPTGQARRDCLQRIALANAVTEKAVAMVYEKNRRPDALHWREWQDRLARQIRGGLAALEERTGDGFAGGDRPDGGDIAFVLAHDFLAVTNAWLLEPGRPRLAALAKRAAQIPAFADTLPVAA